MDIEKKKDVFIIITSIVIFVGGVFAFWWITMEETPDATNPEDQDLNQSENDDVDIEDRSQMQQAIKPTVEVIQSGLDHPWDIKKDTEGNIFFTQRGKGLYQINPEDGEEAKLITPLPFPDDLYVAGEGGMLGFDLDTNFDQSRVIYSCFNSNKDGNLNVVVARLVLSEDLTEIVSREDIIPDIPANTSGRHSGCRVAVRAQDDIWIGTGDAAEGENPQDPDSLGGKVLRVDSQGRGVNGNLKEPFDDRIFSYGHRNIQGLVVFEEYDEIYGWGYTAEHGPDVDDEINPLKKGNFGWDPKPPYGENVPMTDTEKFPEAIEAFWSSGKRTVAACGLEYIRGDQWQDWQGDLLLAALKDSYIMKLQLDDEGRIQDEKIVLEGYGRIRQVYQSQDGAIYFTTDNGGDDIIGKISP
jgi:glucose/arabinose dehydrogenase